MGGLWQEWGGSRSGVKPFRVGSWRSAGCSLVPVLPGGADPHLGLLRHPKEEPPCPADTPHLREKVILQQVVQAGPLGWVGGQQAGDEAARVGRQVCRLRVVAISDVLVHLRQGSRHERRDASQHHVPGQVGGRKQGTCLDLFWASRLGSHLPVHTYPQSLTPSPLHIHFLTPALRPLSPSHSCLHRRQQHLSIPCLHLGHTWTYA